MPSAIYREVSPGGELRGLVECIWTIRSHGPLRAVQLNRVVPDGCTDVIVDLGDGSTGGGAPRAAIPRTLFVGAMLRPRVIEMTGAVDLVGVRLRPGVGGTLLGMPASELTDRTVDLDEVLPASRAAGLGEELSSAGDPSARIAALEAHLRRWFRRAHPAPPAVGAAVGLIERSRGAIPVRELERRIGLSARQLERLFARYAGMTPKTACRVARFRTAWRRLHRPEPISLSRLALGCGYADQAHLTREFHAFAGLPPGRYRVHRAHVASVQDPPAPPG